MEKSTAREMNDDLNANVEKSIFFIMTVLGKFFGPGIKKPG
jgi:hypothetical protein